jgi:hypothetical protein
MPVMGPTYSDDQVEVLYQKVMSLLKENGIQTFSTNKWPFYQRDRDKRNAQLRLAIEKLVELESWESF